MVIMVKIAVLVKMIWLLILCQIAAPVIANGDNFSSAYFITREHRRLVGHLVKKMESTTFMTCSHSCLRNPWCTSTNFKGSVGQGEKGTCELNKHDFAPINDDAKLIDQSGTTFTMMLKGCLMTRCLNEGSCLFDKKKETFTCSCKFPWIGDKCELKRVVSFRFTSLGMQGRSGPISTSGYTGTSLQGTVTLDKGIQIWTVPFTALYIVTVAGASGGDANKSGGRGAVVSGAVQLVEGTQLRILIGQKGVKGTSSAGGGGGTFVADGNYKLLLAAGGGGGGGGQITSQAGDNGQTNESGSQFGGMNGLGGTVNGTQSSDAGGGGGFNGNGMCCLFNTNTKTCGYSTCDQAGRSYLNGGLGGNGNGDGGFGGGGAADSNFAGGGGGYSGGGVYAVSFGAKGGGGGSYCTADLKPSNDKNDGDGYVLLVLESSSN